MREEYEIDTLIIGAGIIGLAAASELSKNKGNEIFVVEKHDSFCIETSSHNSEVIHGGIYYQKNSLKSKYCSSGRDLLYDFCTQYAIPFKRCGKYIAINSEEQIKILHDLRNNAFQNNVNLNFLDHTSLKKIRNMSHFFSALYSENTGIVDSYQLAKRLIQISSENSVTFLYRNKFHKLLEKSDYFYTVSLEDYKKNLTIIKCKNIVNAAGLSSARIAQEFFQDKKYNIIPCLGRYFSLSRKFNNYFDSLVYPLPDPAGGLGLHVTFDLQKNHRLGPDVSWNFSTEVSPDDDSLYRFGNDEIELKNKFFHSGKKLIPHLELNDIHKDYIGIRPKIFVNNNLYEDFLIKTEKFTRASSIHFLGIESPGLTSALALAKETRLFFETGNISS